MTWRWANLSIASRNLSVGFALHITTSPELLLTCEMLFCRIAHCDWAIQIGCLPVAWWRFLRGEQSLLQCQNPVSGWISGVPLYRGSGSPLPSEDERNPGTCVDALCTTDLVQEPPHTLNRFWQKADLPFPPRFRERCDSWCNLSRNRLMRCVYFLYYILYYSYYLCLCVHQ